MSKDQSQIAHALESQAQASNEALGDTLQQLFYQVQPKVQAEYLIEDITYRLEKVKYDCLTTIDEARDGDPEARKKLLKAAGVGVAVAGLCILRRKLKRRHHR